MEIVTVHQQKVMNTDLVQWHPVAMVTTVGCFGQCYCNHTLYVAARPRVLMFPLCREVDGYYIGLAYTSTTRRPSTDTTKGKKWTCCQNQASRYHFSSHFLPSIETSLATCSGGRGSQFSQNSCNEYCFYLTTRGCR